MAEIPPSSPANWVRPSEVMHVRKLRAKRHALQARMNATSNPLPIRSKSVAMSLPTIEPKRNPFRSSSQPTNNSLLMMQDASSDATLFNLLHNPLSSQKKPEDSPDTHYSFSDALRQNGIASKAEKKEPEKDWQDNLAIDWSLKTKLRFTSDKPLPWKNTFKTSEEASGTTGMTRCLWSCSDSSELDTSPNAQFFQRCLVWQHPSLPGVTLYPRDGTKTSSLTLGRQVSSTSTTGPYADARLSSSLHASWCESLRSLHQLIRVRQCPFFYLCAPTFTVLYRAAGVSGVPHAHALLTPTTRGLRNAMREEGIDFKMPFHKAGHLTSDYSNSSGGSSTSCGGNSSSCGGFNQSPTSLNVDLSHCGSTVDSPPFIEEEDIVPEEEDLDAPLDDKEATSFLADLGVDTSQFSNLNSNRHIKSSKEIDRTPLSMVMVSDPDTQGLTNFLLNSPSCVQATGPLAGVPPTLLAPVAFQGATLLPHKVKSSSLRVKGSLQYSMEVSGPILPQTPVQLCSLLANHTREFSLQATPLAQTIPFSNCTRDGAANVMTKAFAEGGLIDCGLDEECRSLVCVPLKELPTDGEEASLPPVYRHVTHKQGKYTWSDKSGGGAS